RSSVATYAVGGLLGGLAGAVFVVIVTLVIKATMDFVSNQVTWVLIVVPLLGLTLGVLVLQRYGQSGNSKTLVAAASQSSVGLPPARRWKILQPGGIQADITGDVVDSAGEEERFPWRQTPVRTLAIFATVGLGAAMGTEAPAAYFGVAAGACL